MALREINFDGIVGPSHNYAGLSLGNLASTRKRRPVRSPAPRRCRASTRCARTSRSAWRRAFSAAPAPEPGVARRAWNDDRGGRAGARRQRHVGLGDVGGQCRDRLARARHGRRQVPPDRRQSAHHAAPQPRMAGDAGAAADRLRGEAFAVHAPVPPAFGDEGAANHMRLAPAHGEPGVELFVYGVVRRRFPGAPASRSVEGDRPAAPARPRAHDVCRAVGGSDRGRRVPQRRRRRRQRARAVRARAGLRRQGGAARRRASGWFPASNMSRCRPPTCRLPTRSGPICSTRSS